MADETYFDGIEFRGYRRPDVVYRRYAIVNEADLGDAVARLATTQSQDRYRTATERQGQGPNPLQELGPEPRRAH